MRNNCGAIYDPKSKYQLWKRVFDPFKMFLGQYCESPRERDTKFYLFSFSNGTSTMSKGFFTFMITLLVLVPGLILGQDTGQQDEQFTIDTPASLDFKKEEEPEAPKKKKPKKKVFYGLKTKKGFTRKGVGERITFETFYYLKRPEKPQPFVRDVYWYDFIRKE